MSYRKKNCKECIERIKNGDEERKKCIDEIYNQYFGFVKYFDRKFKKLSKDDVFSIYNEAVAELIRRVDAGTFEAKGDRACSTFIYKIVRNLCISLNKKDERYIYLMSGNDNDDKEVVIEPPDMDELPEISGHFEKGRWKSLWEDEKLSICFGKLSPKCQKVLILWAKGYSMREVAEILAPIPNANNAAVIKFQCLKALKRYINDYLGGLSE